MMITRTRPLPALVLMLPLLLNPAVWFALKLHSAEVVSARFL